MPGFSGSFAVFKEAGFQNCEFRYRGTGINFLGVFAHLLFDERLFKHKLMFLFGTYSQVS